jgi:hypothetical protein
MGLRGVLRDHGPDLTPVIIPHIKG